MGNKKKAALAGLSKKERKALEKKAARLQAELAEREAAKKAGKKDKKSKGEKAAKKRAEALADEREADRPLGELPETDALTVTPAAEDAKAERRRKRAEAKSEATDPSPADTIAAAARSVIEGNSTPDAVADAEDSLAAALEANPGETVEEIRERVKAKRQARADGVTEAEIQARVSKVKAARMPDAHEGETEVEYQQRKLAEKKAKKPAASSNVDKGGLVAAAEEHALAKAAEAVEAIGQAIEIVETEHGREFAAGTSVEADEFAKPSEAPKRFEDDTNGLGQYKVARPSDGKVVGYTRWTTYIDCLEDKKALEMWKARIILEGVAAAEEDGDAVTGKVRDLAHRRDVAIAKARKADRKGKLDPGELATYVDGAWGEFKKALDKLADEVFEVGGGREKATKGTDIHALCDLAESKGIAAVGDLLTAGEITPSDLADVEAYLDAIRRLGAKPILAEQVVVNDDLKVAGRLDRVYMVKLPGETRGRRRVVDLKTGRIDYGMGKIAQQIEGYAGSVAYDPETHERTPLGVDRTLGLVIHLPAGTGRVTVHRVDLGLGRKGNKLAGEVRAWRNEGKRAIDLKANVLDEIEAATDADAMTGGE